MTSHSISRTARILSMLLCWGMLLLAGCNWSGRVVDARSGEPIEGVVVVRLWERDYATVGGVVSEGHAAQEGRSGADGHFSVPGKIYLPMGIKINLKYLYMPLPFETYEKPALVFKPGYEPVLARAHKDLIRLEPVPTILAIRKLALGAVENRLHPTLWSMPDDRKGNIPELSTMLWEEEDFLTIDHPSGYSIVRPKPPRRSAPQASPPGRVHRFSAPKFVIPAGLDLSQPPPPGVDFDTWQQMKEQHVAETVMSQLVSPTLVELGEDHTLRQTGKVSDDALADLIAGLRSNDPHVRAKAASALDSIPDSRVIDALNALFEDPDGNVTQAAVRVLGRNTPQTVDALIRWVKHPDAQTRIEAAKSLCADGGERGLEAVFAALLEERSDSRRALLVRYYAGANSPQVPSRLATLLRDPYGGVRAAAHAVLVELGETAAPAIRPLLAAREASLRWRAARILGEIGDRASVPTLLALLDDPEATVRWSATLSLGQIGDPQGTAWLQQRKVVADEAVRTLTEDALAHIAPVASQ